MTFPQHSYIANGLGGKSGSVVVDLSGLTQISVASSGLATISTGNRVGDIATALNDKGRALPHGICPYLGIGGHACMLTFLSLVVVLSYSLGPAFGGWGITSRMWGLTLDTVQSLDIVLANGTIATVSGSDDLFWVRGMWPIKRPHCLIEFIRR